MEQANSNLGSWLVDQLITEKVDNIKTIVAIYPGRFQPMGKHHAQAYKWLKSKFDDAFIQHPIKYNYLNLLSVLTRRKR